MCVPLGFQEKFSHLPMFSCAVVNGFPALSIQSTAAADSNNCGHFPNFIGGGFCDKKNGLPGLAALRREWEHTLIFSAPVEWIGEIKAGRRMTIQGFTRSAWLKRAFVNGILPLPTVRYYKTFLLKDRSRSVGSPKRIWLPSAPFTILAEAGLRKRTIAHLFETEQGGSVCILPGTGL